MSHPPNHNRSPVNAPKPPTSSPNIGDRKHRISSTSSVATPSPPQLSSVARVDHRRDNGSDNDSDASHTSGTSNSSTNSNSNSNKRQRRMTISEQQQSTGTGDVAVASNARRRRRRGASRSSPVHVDDGSIEQVDEVVGISSQQQAQSANEVARREVAAEAWVVALTYGRLIDSPIWWVATADHELYVWGPSLCWALGIEAGNFGRKVRTHIAAQDQRYIRLNSEDRRLRAPTASQSTYGIKPHAIIAWLARLPRNLSVDRKGQQTQWHAMLVHDRFDNVAAPAANIGTPRRIEDCKLVIPRQATVILNTERLPHNFWHDHVIPTHRPSSGVGIPPLLPTAVPAAAATVGIVSTTAAVATSGAAVSTVATTGTTASMMTTTNTNVTSSLPSPPSHHPPHHYHHLMAHHTGMVAAHPPPPPPSTRTSRPSSSAAAISSPLPLPIVAGLSTLAAAASNNNTSMGPRHHHHQQPQHHYYHLPSQTHHQHQHQHHHQPQEQELLLDVHPHSSDNNPVPDYHDDHDHAHDDMMMTPDTVGSVDRDDMASPNISAPIMTPSSVPIPIPTPPPTQQQQQMLSTFPMLPMMPPSWFATHLLLQQQLLQQHQHQQQQQHERSSHAPSSMVMGTSPAVPIHSGMFQYQLSTHVPTSSPSPSSSSSSSSVPLSHSSQQSLQTLPAPPPLPPISSSLRLPSGGLSSIMMHPLPSLPRPPSSSPAISTTTSSSSSSSIDGGHGGDGAAG
jgi:hypothetical protein